MIFVGFAGLFAWLILVGPLYLFGSWLNGDAEIYAARRAIREREEFKQNLRLAEELKARIDRKVLEHKERQKELTGAK